jgi:hypothetical protein
VPFEHRGAKAPITIDFSPSRKLSPKPYTSLALARGERSSRIVSAGLSTALQPTIFPGREIVLDTIVEKYTLKNQQKQTNKKFRCTGLTA